MRKKFAFKIHSKISKMTPKTKNTLKFDHFRVQFKDPYFSKDAMRKKIRSKNTPKNLSWETPKCENFYNTFCDQHFWVMVIFENHKMSSLVCYFRASIRLKKADFRHL